MENLRKPLRFQRFAVVLLLLWCAVVQAAVGADPATVRLWHAQPSLDGQAFAPVHWVSMDAHWNTLRIGDAGSGPAWVVRLSSDAGSPAPQVQLQRVDGDTTVDVPVAIRKGKTPGTSILSARPADGGAPLRIAFTVTDLRDPRADRSKSLPPTYPPEAMREGVQGLVMLEVDLDPAGSFLAARILRARPVGYFEEAALRSVPFWRFNPIRNALGFTVPGSVPVPVAFKIEDSAPADNNPVKRKRRFGPRRG